MNLEQLPSLNQFKPRMKNIGAWTPHLAFGYDLISLVQPRVLVELGTEKGESFFAFCQAIEASGATTQAFAVDSWLGDYNTGAYGENIYQDFCAYRQNHYAAFTHVLRGTFSQARSRFEAGSIGVLHIDGSHRFEDVTRDFEEWLPAMAPGGIILFHDILVRENDFGVWKLWERLVTEYSTFTLEDGAGLGVLRLPGGTPHPFLDVLFGGTGEQKARFQRYYSLQAQHHRPVVQNPAAGTPSLAIGCMAQVFPPTHHGYTQETSVTKSILNSDWVHLDMVWNSDGAPGKIRFDLVCEPAYVEIDSFVLFEFGSHKEVWKSTGHGIESKGDAFILSRIDGIKVIVFGGDPQLFLSTEFLKWNPGKYTLSVHLRIQTGSDTVRQMAETAIVAQDGLEKLLREADDRFHQSQRAWRDERGRVLSMQRTWSWRLTLPLRLLGRCLGLKSPFISPQDLILDPHKSWNKRPQDDYGTWVLRNDTLRDKDKKRIRQLVLEMQNRPRISVLVPVYNPEESGFRQMIESVLNQIYPVHELCLADDCSTNPRVRDVILEYAQKDPRVRYIFRDVNGHISETTNSALSLATGDFVAFMDHDDLLPDHALYLIAKEISENPEAGLIYTDEDKMDAQGVRSQPYFKPDWSPELLESQNYISHFTIIRTELVRSLGGLQTGYEGSQDYDLILRVTDQLKSEQIRHIPHVLYHWRITTGSTAEDGDAKPYAFDAAKKALSDHLQRLGQSGSVVTSPEHHFYYRLQLDLPSPPPLVSIVIPTRDHAKTLKTCLDSIRNKTNYPRYEIVIVDNGSTHPDALALLEAEERHPDTRVRRDLRPFNYPALNNDAVAESRGEFVLLLNNDMEIINPEWLGEMMAYGLRPGVGAVGARLWYRNQTIQHAGVVLGVGGVAGHAHKYFGRGDYGHGARAILVQNFSAVTAACLLVRKSLYQEVGGMDADSLSVAFNDVDFCLKLRAKGYRCVWTPFAELYHDESLTRGIEDSPEKQQRFRGEVHTMLQRWGSVLIRDPYYNPNLTLDDENFELAMRPHRPYPWKQP